MTLVTRKGFALLGVLAMLTVVAMLVLFLDVTATETIAVSSNRSAELRARWAAESCAERARAIIDLALRAEPNADSVWDRLDGIVAHSVETAGCNVTLSPSGMTLDINTTSRSSLRALLKVAGMDADSSDSLVDAIMDWRDADDLVRPLGAERDWYQSRGRAGPRNAPFGSVAEIHRVRGANQLPGLDTLIGVDSGRILLGRTPLAVLAGLPGFGREALEAVATLRSRGEDSFDVQAVTRLMIGSARDEILAHQQELTALLCTSPDRWIVTAHGYSGHRRIVETIDLTLALAGRRAAVIRRRVWP
jgi:general secretion pathway protein K